MNKAQQIMKELDEAEEAEGITDGTSSKNGDPAHTHPVSINENGEVFEHGPASDGPAHEHPISEEDTGTFLLGPARGRNHPEETDPMDTDHTHTVKVKSVKAK